MAVVFMWNTDGNIKQKQQNKLSCKNYCKIHPLLVSSWENPCYCYPGRHQAEWNLSQAVDLKNCS